MGGSLRVLLFLNATVVAVACRTNAAAARQRAEATAAACRALPVDSALLARGPVYRECEVGTPVAVTRGGAPRLPAAFREAKGDRCDSVRVSFVVDTLGQLEAGSERVLYGGDSALVAAVLASLPAGEYLPAERQGRKVRGLVSYPFYFATRFGMRCGPS